MKQATALLTLSLAVLSASPAAASNPWGIRTATYPEVIQRVSQMPFDQDLQSRARALGLNVVNVMWEDTGRAAGSALGPNISDLTLQVREPVPGGVRTHLLPVIRHPNFSDKTADIPADKLWVRVGNQSGGELVTVPLTEVLSNLHEYLSDSRSLRGSGNFLASRDSHFLVSAQHVFLPIPKSGKAEFNPVLFNYQSAPGSPAVLTLLVTREGTSATVIDNSDGGQSWGQQLYFNNKGQKTTFTAERKSDVRARIAQGRAKASDAGALEDGADMMMIVQVPLIHQNRGYLYGLAGAADEEMAPASAPAPAKSMRRSRGRSDVEQAVLGHGEDLGPFREMAGLEIKRDERFPIRVTVQFYRATSNGVVSQQDLADVHEMIGKVYSSADYVGSLVVPKGERNRPTDWMKGRENIGWWNPNGLWNLVRGW